MYRTRSDGNKFQEEVRRGLTKFKHPIFQVRLHTTSVKSIADFIILGKSVTILEVKETSQKSFSTKTMQQAEVVAEFNEFYKLAREAYGSPPYSIFVLVHFIVSNEYVVYDLLNEPTILHPKDPCCLTFSNLSSALAYVIGEE